MTTLDGNIVDLGQFRNRKLEAIEDNQLDQAQLAIDIAHAYHRISSTLAIELGLANPAETPLSLDELPESMQVFYYECFTRMLSTDIIARGATTMVDPEPPTAMV